jgi:hypothetical protein
MVVDCQSKLKKKILNELTKERAVTKTQRG